MGTQTNMHGHTHTHLHAHELPTSKNSCMKGMNITLWKTREVGILMTIISDNQLQRRGQNNALSRNILQKLRSIESFKVGPDAYDNKIHYYYSHCFYCQYICQFSVHSSIPLTLHFNQSSNVTYSIYFQKPNHQ